MAMSFPENVTFWDIADKWTRRRTAIDNAVDLMSALFFDFWLRLLKAY
jgi:hypothetical protein